MSVELAPEISGAPTHRWKPYSVYKDSGVEWQVTRGSNTFNIFQTGLTGSTGCVLFLILFILLSCQK